MDVEWDEDKRLANIRKHGVDFEDALDVFVDPAAYEEHDDEHSDDEHRQKIIGFGRIPAMLCVVYTERRGNVVRIITARKANQREKRTYYANALHRR